MEEKIENAHVQEWFKSELSHDTEKSTSLKAPVSLDFEKISIFEEGGQKIASSIAKNAFNSAYTNASSNLWLTFDLIQPFFNIEPRNVLLRLLSTLKPQPMKDIIDQPDLYGPLMCLFTLNTILVLSMKNSRYQFHHSSESTLLGTSFFTCFIYLIFNTLLCYFSFWSTNISLGLVQCISLVGYELFSLCIVLLLNLFYVSWIYTTFLCILFGGLSTLSIIRTLYIDSNKKSLLISFIISFIHLLFLVYLLKGYGLIYHENIFKL